MTSTTTAPPTDGHHRRVPHGAADRRRPRFQPTLFTEGVRLSPGREDVLLALDYLDAVPNEPQEGRTTAEVAAQSGITPHVVRARLVDLRAAGFVRSGDCPRYFGRPLFGADVRHAHYLTPDGHRRSRWAIVGRPKDGAIGGQEHRLLGRLYLALAVPTDRLARSSSALASIGDAFREKTGRGDADAELLRHMVASRKHGYWPHLGRRPRDAFAAAAAESELSDDEHELLHAIYVEQGTPSDEVMLGVRQGRALARAFAEATGDRLPARLLVDQLIADRKAGCLPRLAGPEVA